MDKIIHLSLTRKSPVLMDIVQSSTEPSITFILDDYTPPSGATARIFIKKKDAEVYNNCTISGNTIRYTPTAGSFDVPGKCEAQIQILKSTTVAVTYRILVLVEPNFISGSAAPASTEYDALTTLIQNASKYDSIINANNIVGANGRQGWISITMNQDLNALITPGIYMAPNLTVVNTLTNIPTKPAVGGGFKMVVERTLNAQNQFRQTIIQPHQADTGTEKTIEKKYIRQTVDNGETWTEWVYLPSRSEVNAIANAGAKNHFLNKVYPFIITKNYVSLLSDPDGSMSVFGTPTEQTTFDIGTIAGYDLVQGRQYILSGCPEGGSTTGYRLVLTNPTVVDTGNGVTFTNSGYSERKVQIIVPKSSDLITLSFMPMIREASIQDDSFVGFGLDNHVLTQVALENNIAGSANKLGWKGIPNGTDLNTMLEPGIYYVSNASAAGTLINCPRKDIFVMEIRAASIIKEGDNVGVRQIIYPHLAVETGEAWIRTVWKGGQSVSPWIFIPTRVELDAAINSGVKNFLKTTVRSNIATPSTITSNGITFTVLDDSSVVANGTATENAGFTHSMPFTTRKSTTYTLSGCPEGGSATTYALYLDGSPQRIDHGSGVKFTDSADTTRTCRIIIYKGTTVDNLRFYPMLKYSQIQNNDYVQYARSNNALTQSLGPLNVESAYFGANSTGTHTFTLKTTTTYLVLITRMNTNVQNSNSAYLITPFTQEGRATITPIVSNTANAEVSISSTTLTVNTKANFMQVILLSFSPS